MATLKSDPVAIVLAAGESSRFGGDKMFADLGGKPLIERTLGAYKDATHVHDVVLVIPPGASDRYAAYRSPHVHLAENPDPSRGMISSIRAGLETTWTHERAFLIAPGDVPFVKPEIVDRLATEFVTRNCKIVIPAYRGLGGHPGLFADSLREDVFLRGDTSGTREILVRYRTDTVRMNVADPDVCFDLDEPSDLEMAMDAGARWARVEEMADEKRRPKLR